MVDRERFESMVRAKGERLSLVCLDSCGSTNDECARLAHAGEPAGLVVIADAQTAGRGRFDRTWVSPPGGNLYMSALVRPEPSAFSLQPSALRLMPADWCALGLLASLSVLDAVERVLSTRAPGVRYAVTGPRSPVVLKWPNDLLVGDRKLCGILSTSGMDVRGEPYAVVGIGVNLNAPPPGMDGSAATFAELCGGAPDVTEFAAGVAAGFFIRYGKAMEGGFGAQFREWEKRSGWIGRRVTVSIGGPGEAPAPVSGTATGLGERGALRLRLHDGRIEEIFAGDASLKEPERQGSI